MDHAKELRGKLGKAAYLEDWITKITSLTASDSTFNVTFDWDEEIGIPGAFIIKNYHHSEFYLKTLTLEDVPGHGQIHFVCNSWVYPAEYYKKDRVFFTNQTYLPSETPAPLCCYRKEELGNLGGDGTGKLEEWDSVYDYACYNDLGNDRPILGGSTKYPYPRRGRTGRPPAEKDPRYESRLPLLKSTNIYVPRDEKFSHLKMSDVIAYGLRSVFQFLLPEFEAQFDKTPSEFDKLDDILELYEGGIKLPNSDLLESIRREIPSETLRELLRSDGQGTCKFPTPQVIKEDKSAWRTDEEFAREMLAGVNPIVIRCLKIYATRTLLFLKNDCTLKPLAIELSLPLSESDRFRVVSKVCTPAQHGIEGTIWLLAKAYVAVNDSGYHQLICHWLNTHATIEPFVIATNRQLSVLHPIYKLLHPHFRDTMNINVLARQALINAGGLLEMTVFPQKYAMEMSAVAYKDWVFPEQALPADLIKRGMAVKDSNSPHGLRLLIEDYPYAIDRLEISSAIKTWVEHYCCFYYKPDDMVQNDSELQSWWKELQEKGHRDKKDEPWWPEMQSRKELIDSCTIIIWVASTLHTAVNFGQYPYGGYLPNRLAMSCRLIPEPNSPDYDELNNREEIFLKTITAQLQSIIGISLIEILSMHSADEVFLGQRDTPHWTANSKPLEAFKEFGEKLEEIEERIKRMNKDKKLKNRVGPVKMPYTLLYPTSEVGLTGKGIPNSISI
ncbi:hypothetical protein F0562_029348 [Nyssa sinensis]|uniref:Lipoxygenase n=1 Tax=Nyssa sinensis TaxID=561372 RepID=A0A5J5B2T6_9ASTE|nr:hypothetical protein F0562_029348 [Nyssa sinensis]